MRHFILPFFTVALASAQIVSVGIKAGIPATDAVSSGSTSTSLVDTGRWTVGPTIELRLIYGFSLEADALYRGYRQLQTYAFTQFVQEGITLPPVSGTIRSDTKVWDFPVLLKYRFGDRKIRPFINAGYSWSHSTSDVTSSFVCLGGPDVCSGSNLTNYFGRQNSNVTNGPAAGIGLEFTIGRFKLAPEIRYTNESYPTVNRITVLAGFTF